MRKKNYFGITLLRSLAASLVLIIHSSTLLSFERHISNQVMLTNVGVDIFFVISGFIITYAHWDDFGKGKASIKHFIKKRVIRIYPMYLLFTLITAFALLILPQFFFSSRSSLLFFISSLFFLPSEMENGDITLLLAVAWTLSYEVVFYLIFSIALFFRRTTSLIIISVAIIVWSLLGLLPHSSYLSSYFLTTLPLEFLAGILICTVSKNHENAKFTSPKQAFLLTILSVLMLYSSLLIPEINLNEARENARLIYFGMPAIIVFVGLFNLTSPANRIVVKLIEMTGNASYVTYLSHFLTIGCIKFVMRKIPVLQTILLPMVVIFSCLLCTFVGVFIHYYIEKPLLSLLKNKSPVTP